MSNPNILVEIKLDGKTFVEQMEVNMDGLAAAIVDRALNLTDANDRSDSAAEAADEFDPNDRSPEAAALEKTIEDADTDYNNEKARLFALCRLMAQARIADTARAAIAKAGGAVA